MRLNKRDYTTRTWKGIIRGDGYRVTYLEDTRCLCVPCTIGPQSGFGLATKKE